MRKLLVVLIFSTGICLAQSGGGKGPGGGGGGGGTGTVTSVSGLSPLFTTTNPSTTPTFVLSNAAANSLFGNFTGSAAPPTFSTTPAFSGVNITGLNASNLASGTVPVGRLPLATTSAAGVVEPDGTTITISNGVISSVGGGGGSGTVSGQANGVIPLGTAATAIGAQSHMDDGVTTAGTITSTEPIAAPSVATSGSGSGAISLSGSASGTAVLTVSSTAGTPTLTLPTATGGLIESSSGLIQGQLAAGSSSANLASAHVYYADAFPSSCTVNAVNYTTQADCAWYTIANAGTGGELIFGAGTYTTNACLVEPTVGPQISIRGSSSSGNEMPTTIQAGTGCTSAVISHPVISSTQSIPYGATFSDFNIDANNHAASCWDMYAERVGYASHINCRNWTGTDHAWKVGNENPGSGNMDGSYQFFYTDIFIQQVTTPAPSWANVTVTGSTPTFTIVSGGVYSNTTVPAFLVGTPNGSMNPCSTPGTTTATITGGTLTAITSTASGCPATYYVMVPDMKPTLYPFVVGYDTDSTFTDIVTSGGTAAGIKFYHGGNVIVHAHPIEAYVGIQNNAPNDFLGTELDSNIAFGVDNEDPNSTYTATKFTWNNISDYNGSSGFYFGISPSREYVVGDTCGNGQILQAGYHQFTQSTGAYSEAVGTVLPGTFNGDVNCDNLSIQQYGGNGVFNNLTIAQDNATGAVQNIGLGDNATVFSAWANRVFEGYNVSSSNMYLLSRTALDICAGDGTNPAICQTANADWTFTAAGALARGPSRTTVIDASGNASLLHTIGIGTAPTITAGSGAGTSPTLALDANAHDASGTITLTAGTSPAASATIATLTFGTAFTTSPHCSLTPNNAATVAVPIDKSQTVSTLVIAADTTALTASTAYSWDYICQQ